MADKAWIPTVLVHRPDGSMIYVTSEEYHKSPQLGKFAEKYSPRLERPEVCRKYESVVLGRSAGGRKLPVHYELREVTSK